MIKKSYKKNFHLNSIFMCVKASENNKSGTQIANKHGLILHTHTHTYTRVHAYTRTTFFPQNKMIRK